MRKKQLILHQKEVIESLRNLTIDIDKPYIVSGQRTYSVNDVIREVDNFTDFGSKFIRSWVNLNK